MTNQKVVKRQQTFSHQSVKWVHIYFAQWSL